MRPTHSIVAPIVLLVIAAAMIATGIQFGIMFNGPPPGPGPLPLTRVVEALKTGKAPTEIESRMVVTRGTQPAVPQGRLRHSPARDAAIARQMAVPADQVRGFYDRPPRDPQQDVMGPFVVSARVGSEWITVRREPPRPFTHWHWSRLIGALVTLALLSLLAWLVASRISRPIRRLAEAATSARLGARATIPQEGPREVRELAAAIEAMQARIMLQAEGRTAMLGAIAHDLGTPLSRLAFYVEQLPEKARERAAADIEEMRMMLSAALRYTRDDRAGQPHARLDLGSLIESLADDLEAAGTPVSVEPSDRAVIEGDSASLRRLFGNLIENAVRYGKRAHIGWTLEAGWVEVTVDDDGPGFPANDADALFAPFARGETSRNRATGGTGLGLAIVRSIVDAHAGQVRLETRAAGGGRVRVRLRV